MWVEQNSTMGPPQNDLRGPRRTPNNANQSILGLLQSICSGDTSDTLRQLQLRLPSKNGIKSCTCVVHLILLQVDALRLFTVEIVFPN